jgi:hypothetical protein
MFFDGYSYRTERINEAVRPIYLLHKEWDKKKKGKIEINFALSSFVPGTGIGPALLCDNRILSLV